MQGNRGKMKPEGVTACYKFSDRPGDQLTLPPRPATRDGRNMSFTHHEGMTNDWRGRVILEKLAEGCTFMEAATAAGMSRQALWKRCRSSPSFAQAVSDARQQGQEEREYRLWLRHPFRGRRPPTGKGHRGKPRFRYGNH